jgi:CheY-specific phosphatase CheX
VTTTATSLSESAQTFATIQQYLVTGTVDLFGAYGISVEHASGGSAEIKGLSVMALTGYAGDNVRGALLILASCDVVSAIEPQEVRDTGVPVDVSLRDVLGEFSNMLLGRVKNQLSLRAVAPLLTTPTTVFGRDLQLPVPRSGMSAWHTFTCNAGSFFVRFDATFDPEFTLDPNRKPPTVLEGEVVLF